MYQNTATHYGLLTLQNIINLIVVKITFEKKKKREKVNVGCLWCTN